MVSHPPRSPGMVAREQELASHSRPYLHPPAPPTIYVIFAGAEAAKRIIELSHDGLVDRLRKRGCGNWFFAKFSHQKFCSGSCHKEIYKSSAEWKKYRRDYMKRNRALHQQKLFQ